MEKTDRSTDRMKSKATAGQVRHCKRDEKEVHLELLDIIGYNIFIEMKRMRIAVVLISKLVV